MESVVEELSPYLKGRLGESWAGLLEVRETREKAAAVRWMVGAGITNKEGLQHQGAGWDMAQVPKELRVAAGRVLRGQHWGEEAPLEKVAREGTGRGTWKGEQVGKDGVNTTTGEGSGGGLGPGREGGS